METNTNNEQQQSNQISQDPKISIMVQASELYNSTYPATEDLIDKFTYVEDNKGDKAGYGEKKKEFSTAVHKNEKVVWDIKNDNSELANTYKLELICIDQKLVPDNYNIFGYDVLVPRNKKIEAEVLDINKSVEYTYRIIFTISHNNDIRAYSIDPKMPLQIS